MWAPEGWQDGSRSQRVTKRCRFTPARSRKRWHGVPPLLPSRPFSFRRPHSDPSTSPPQTVTGQGQASRRARVGCTGSTGVWRRLTVVTRGPCLQAERPGQEARRAAVGEAEPQRVQGHGALDRLRLRAEVGGPGAGSKVWGQAGPDRSGLVDSVPGNLGREPVRNPSARGELNPSRGMRAALLP